MTVRQLKKAIEHYPDNMDVFIAERKTDFAYGLLNSVKVKEISLGGFGEEDEEDVAAVDRVVILDEE